MMEAVSGRPRRGEALLVLASVAAFLLVAEVAVRLLGLAKARPTGYAPVYSGARALGPQNERGYRDLERRLEKPPGTRRVVCLGDSFSWGSGVEFEDAFPQRLERGLTRRRKEAWEVVNLARPAMNTVDELSVLVREGFAYDPDVVLLGYVLNDSEDPGSAETRRAEDWKSAQGPPPSVLDASALCRMIRLRLWATRENRRRLDGFLSMYADDAPGWVESRRALRQIGARCREHGVPFVVAIFPLFGNPLDESYPFTDIHRKVAQAAAEAGARVVDLLPAFRGLRWDVLVVDGVDDEHPNEIAHRIAARTILRALDDAVPWTRGGAASDEPPEPAPR
jgi:GDSL-like Lipase/Acylhydrolase family